MFDYICVIIYIYIYIYIYMIGESFRGMRNIETSGALKI
jgi:hypothetical protein